MCMLLLFRSIVLSWVGGPCVIHSLTAHSVHSSVPLLQMCQTVHRRIHLSLHSSSHREEEERHRSSMHSFISLPCFRPLSIISSSCVVHEAMLESCVMSLQSADRHDVSSCLRVSSRASKLTQHGKTTKSISSQWNRTVCHMLRVCLFTCLYVCPF